MRQFWPLLLLVLSACAPGAVRDTPTAQSAPNAVSRAAFEASDLPAMKTFGPPRPKAPQVANNDIALDFIQLAFQLESGRELPVFTRFEGQISVRLTGAPTASMQRDLSQLIARLRREAGIDIIQTAASNANITIEAVSRAEIRRASPSAACFVVPNITRISQYRRAKRASRTNWTTLRQRETLAIFLPNDSSPQEARDCLHEELAQAIGPLNDLYRLSDSVFNDDNVHTVLTGFDMLILRAFYAPELRSGMTRGQVSARLPGILARINPTGEGRRATFATRTPGAWSAAIQTALGPTATPNQRRKAANRALQIATAMGWRDHRRAFAHYAQGRLLMASDPARAAQQFQRADHYYAQAPGTELHRAYVASQLAAFAITEGRGADALARVTPHLALAERHENAALLATLLLLKAEALDLLGRPNEARTVRLDSLGWARYGFGPDWAVRAKLREIAALNPVHG